MTGSNPFSVKPSDNFNRSFKKLGKTYGATFTDKVEEVLEELIDESYPTISRNEPLPSNLKLPEGWTFHKIAFKHSKGASGQIRLMYLVNGSSLQIKLLWIYTHEQFTGRPADKNLKSTIREILDF